MTLLEPVVLAGLRLPNRLIVAPMSRMQANADGTVSRDMPAYYALYVRKGAGLVITEAIYVDELSGRAYFNQPGLVGAAQRDGWKQVVQAVHAAGGRIFAQLQHGGRLAEPGLNSLHLAASDGAAAGNTWQTGAPNAPARAATRDEVAGFAQSFAAAAGRAREAGFDGVEIHGARGYLLDDFLSATSNRRDDEYGGSLENRLRLPQEVLEQVRRAVGAQYPLGYNLSLYKMDDISYGPPGGADEIRHIARSLEAAGADLIHVSTRRALRPEAWGTTLVRTIGDAVDRSQVIANGGLSSIEDCNRALTEGAQAVSLARPMLANPDWLALSSEGRPTLKYSPGMEREPLKTA